MHFHQQCTVHSTALAVHGTALGPPPGRYPPRAPRDPGAPVIRAERAANEPGGDVESEG